MSRCELCANSPRHTFVDHCDWARLSPSGGEWREMRYLLWSLFLQSTLTCIVHAMKLLYQFMSVIIVSMHPSLRPSLLPSLPPSLPPSLSSSLPPSLSPSLHVSLAPSIHPSMYPRLWVALSAQSDANQKITHPSVTDSVVAAASADRGWQEPLALPYLCILE